MEIKKEVLPVDFDGVFRFTNWTDREFKAKWDNVEYTFPPLKTTPMTMNFTPIEIQNIRKKFAKELAIREFYGSSKFNMMNTSHLDKSGQPTGGMPAVYTESDLIPYTQKCLEPLPIAKAEIKVLPKDSADNYRKNSKGKPITRVLEDGESLTSQASGPMEE